MTIGLYGSRGFVRVLAIATLGWVLGTAGCGADESEIQDETPGEEDILEDELALFGDLAEGKRLFDEETFGGNGRTCLTCHSKRTGTLNPAQVRKVFHKDPEAPLFKHDGSDDFLGNGTSRILEDATILVRMRLPPGVQLAGDAEADAKQVVLRRAIPTTMNTPRLVPELMLDGRAKTLEGQANGAIRGHAQATVLPTEEDLERIAAFEKTAGRFFSSHKLRLYAEGGPEPQLPAGCTPAQKRGKTWFEGSPSGPPLNSNSPRKGLCKICHSGPMLNETTPALAMFPVPDPYDTRFQSVLVSELNSKNNPVYTFVFPNADGTTTTATSPDPGRALITGDFVTTPFGLYAPFKIVSLWGVPKTAPYFHDNSAATLADVVEHYAEFFRLMTDVDMDGDPPLEMTAQDKKDLVAYLKLL